MSDLLFYICLGVCATSLLSSVAEIRKRLAKEPAIVTASAAKITNIFNSRFTETQADVLFDIWMEKLSEANKIRRLSDFEFGRYNNSASAIDWQNSLGWKNSVKAYNSRKPSQDPAKIAPRARLSLNQ